MSPFFVDFFEKLFVIFAFIGLGLAIYEAMLDRYIKDRRKENEMLSKMRRINDMETDEDGKDSEGISGDEHKHE